MARVVIIGGGVGGLTAAVRLASSGHRVTVLERNEVLGGKLAVREREGFSFDTGPSLVTLPGLFDELFSAAGERTADHLDLRRLDPQFRYGWPDGSTLTVPDGAAAAEAAFEAFAPGAGAARRAFAARARRIWDISERTFLAGPMTNPLDLVRRMRSPRDLTGIDPFPSLARRARQTFDDERLAQWAGRYATYSGSSPFAAPATLACIVHVEAAFGAWYPMGGLGALADAIVGLAARCGAELRTGTEAVAIRTSGDEVAGVELADGTVVPADIVVADVDAEHLYRDLHRDPKRLRRAQAAGRSTSGFVVLAGVQGATPGLAHHNVWFGPDERREFGQLAAGRVADEPTVYACVSSVTDSTQAPPGHENWFLLVNTPADPACVPSDYAAVVLRRLVDHGVDLRERLVFTETIGPAELEARYRAPGGAIYGTSSNGRRAAFARPANRGPVRGLYLVGGSSHPGGGLPLVTISARIVAGMIGADGW